MDPLRVVVESRPQSRVRRRREATRKKENIEKKNEARDARDEGEEDLMPEVFEFVRLVVQSKLNRRDGRKGVLRRDGLTTTPSKSLENQSNQSIRTLYDVMSQNVLF